MGGEANVIASLYWKEEIPHDILSASVQWLSGPTGVAPAGNGFHSWGITGPRLGAARTR